jgi:hypothetical protein
MTHALDQFGRLVISIDKEEQRLLKEAAADESPEFNFDSDYNMHEVFEHLVCNSELDWINPEDTGDMTSAPMLGIRAEDETIINRWAFMDYQIISPQRRLMETGQTIWQK